MRALTHLTLNTGHIVAVARASVSQHTIDHLLPVLDAQGGPVPGMDGWYLDVFFPHHVTVRSDGAAFFQIADEPGTSRRPVAMAVVCWRDDMADDAWMQAVTAYDALRPALLLHRLWREPPEHSPPVPWLAVWLTPFLTLADAEAARAFAGIEQSVAWALIQ